MSRKTEENVQEEKYYTASQYQLMWRKFTKHRLALAGGVILCILYIVALFSEFFSVYPINEYHNEYLYCPPQRIRFFDYGGIHPPFVYGYKYALNPITLEETYVVDKTQKHFIRFFVHGYKYKLWNLFPSDIHFLGLKEPGTLFLFGTDGLGRDLFSRNIAASRISLSIGLVGVFLSFILGVILGGVSGFYGGVADMIIQRIIEFLMSIPSIPLWMGLAAAIPSEWSQIKVYFIITIILSATGWCGLARVVRGKLISLREEDFVMAAKIAGATERKIIIGHLIPSFLSYLIVSLTLAIPNMILGETSLSFLGLGLRAPIVSWGTLLQDCQKIRVVAIQPWLLIPAIFVVITVLAFNFLGDGLRDAADPYK